MPMVEELRGLQRHAGSMATSLLMEMRGTSFEFRTLRSFADADPWCGIAPLPPIEERVLEPVDPLRHHIGAVRSVCGHRSRAKDGTAAAAAAAAVLVDNLSMLKGS